MRRRIAVPVVLVALAICCAITIWLIVRPQPAQPSAAAPGLEKHHDGRAFTTADPWYAPPDESTYDWDEVGRDHLAVVSEPLQPEAQGMLVDAPAKEITADEAQRFTGKPLPGEGVYVLLRAVVLNEGNGAFYVSTRGQDVVVSHGCLGHFPMPMKRKAMVARLPVVPKTVYVDCGMDE